MTNTSGASRPGNINFPPPPPALEDFVAVGNEEALSAVQAVAKGEPEENSLYLWGEPGSGKTHLLRATAIAARKNGKRVFFPRHGEMPPPVSALLIMDDVQKLHDDEQIALFDWHNRAAQKGGSLLLAAGDAPPSRLQNVRDELAARLAGGLVFRLRSLGDSDKRTALNHFAQRHYFSLPEEVADLLLTRLPRDMAGLTAALADLDSFMLAEQKPLTLRRAGAWLSSYRPPPTLFPES